MSWKLPASFLEYKVIISENSVYVNSQGLFLGILFKSILRGK